MNRRQRYALLHPLEAADGTMPPELRQVRRDRGGLLLVTILAVDR